MTPSSVLRQRARNTLVSVFSSEWIYSVLVVLVYSLIMGVSASGVAAIVVFVISGAISVGFCKYFLERSRGNIEFGNVGVCLDGFRGDLAPNIVTGLLVYLYTLLWTLLFIIPGIIKSYAYSMAYYIRCDNPNMTATQAIQESQRLMKGNKFRLFCLQLSFIGWYIVGLLCLGVGVLWVSAYYKAAEAEFYKDLIGVPGFANEENTENLFENNDVFN